MKVAALAGGVGGAKLLVGLQAAEGEDLSAIVNTADDASIYGVHVSPDVDIVTYWLAGIADVERGWGIEGDSFHLVEALRRLNEDAWFNLGDRDFATCVYRTQRFADGAAHAVVTDEIRRSLGVPATVLPMSDDPVRTRIRTTDGTLLGFQDYFVRLRQEPEVAGVELAGIEDAKPAPGVIDAVNAAEVVVVCPSNPVVSIGPILALHGMRDALRAHRRVVAVSPIVEGRALKGPADRMLAALGHESSCVGVARMYRDVCDVFVIDERDAGLEPEIEALGIDVAVTDTIMDTAEASLRLARTVLGSAGP